MCADDMRPRRTAGVIVILCEDRTIRDAIAYWSAMLQVRAIVAEDGYHASHILQRENCQLLLTDRALPPWPGLDIFRHLRERHPDLRIAFIENASRAEVALAQLTGATDVLPHPVQQEAVFQTIIRATRLR